MFKYIISSFFIILLLLGCSSSENLDYSTKEYKGISKDAILNAAKRVIKLSDEDFTISSKRNSISAIRAIPKNKGFTVDININELELNTTTEDETTITTLLIKQKDDIFSDNQKILKGAVHDLFWDRVDYILGLNKNWYSCTEYRLLLHFDGFFCDMKYNSNIYPTEYNIIKDTAITKPAAIEQVATINPTAIDLSSIEGIMLPFKNPPKEEVVVIADLNTSGIFSLGQAVVDTNISLGQVTDTNNTTPEENAKEEDNTTKIFIEDTNTTILEYIEQPLPDELNNSNSGKQIDLLDNNSPSINEKVSEVNDMVIITDNVSIVDLPKKTVEKVTPEMKENEPIIVTKKVQDIDVK